MRNVPLLFYRDLTKYFYEVGLGLWVLSVPLFYSINFKTVHVHPKLFVIFIHSFFKYF